MTSNPAGASRLPSLRPVRRVAELGSFGVTMNTHQVTLNGQAVAMGRDHFRLLTMVRSAEHQDAQGNKVTLHELVMEGVNEFGRVATEFVSPVRLKKGDVIQILVGEHRDDSA